MNKILSTFALFFALATLSGCERGEIEYAGTTCEVPDSSRVTYNTELAEAYKTIDSATADMLKSRGPKCISFSKCNSSVKEAVDHER